MAMNWVLSAHAWAVAKSISGRACIELTSLPVGVKVVMFSAEAEAWDGGWLAYTPLMTDPPDFAAVARIPGYRVLQGPSIPNYGIHGDDSWIDEHGHSASGLFIAGDTYHRHPRTIYIQNRQPWSLKELIEEAPVVPGDTIYWLACRCWVDGERDLPTPTEQAIPWMAARPNRQAPRLPTSILAGVRPGTVHPTPHGS